MLRDPRRGRGFCCGLARPEQGRVRTWNNRSSRCCTRSSSAWRMPAQALGRSGRPRIGGLGTALLPLLALAGALTAAVCRRIPDRGVVAETRGRHDVRRHRPEDRRAALRRIRVGQRVDTLAAGDRHAARLRRRHRDTRSAQRSRRRRGSRPDIRFVFDADNPLAVRAGAESRDAEDGTVVALLSPGLAGGSSTLARGSSVDVDRVVKQNEPLVAVTRNGFREAAEWYREPRPVGRFRAASIGGVLGVALGFITLGMRDDASSSIAWSAIVIGAVALGLRALLPRWIPLNAAGLLLRERANRLREEIASTDVPSVAVGEQLLPWAVLLDEASVIRRRRRGRRGLGRRACLVSLARPVFGGSPRLVHRTRRSRAVAAHSRRRQGTAEGRRLPVRRAAGRRHQGVGRWVPRGRRWRRCGLRRRGIRRRRRGRRRRGRRRLRWVRRRRWGLRRGRRRWRKLTTGFRLLFTA